MTRRHLVTHRAINRTCQRGWSPTAHMLHIWQTNLQWLSTRWQVHWDCVSLRNNPWWFILSNAFEISTAQNWLYYYERHNNPLHVVPCKIVNGMRGTQSMFKAKLIIRCAKKLPKRWSKQCSNSLDMTGLIEIPLKSPTFRFLLGAVIDPFNKGIV